MDTCPQQLSHVWIPECACTMAEPLNRHRPNPHPRSPSPPPHRHTLAAAAAAASAAALSRSVADELAATSMAARRDDRARAAGMAKKPDWTVQVQVVVSLLFAREAQIEIPGMMFRQDSPRQTRKMNYYPKELIQLLERTRTAN